jgi:anti-sigma regulatory factor (Ser/Thr protein kinase)
VSPLTSGHIDDLSWVRVEYESAIGTVRRTATQAADALGFGSERAAEVGLGASELATNAHRHAVAASILVRTRQPSTTGAAASVEVIAIDSGPGVGDVTPWFEDGISTSGTLGIGVGVIQRMANRFDVYSVPGKGTVVVAGFTGTRGEGTQHVLARYDVDGITRPITGEVVSGDAWSAAATADRISVVLADGLGHGPLAATASVGAIAEFDKDPWRGPSGVLHAAHSVIAGTRGAAISAIDIDLAGGVLRFAGIGNVAVRVFENDAGPPEKRSSSLIAQPGIVGERLGKVRELATPISRGALVVLHSDGLTAKWDLGSFAGLSRQAPDVIGAVLLREAGLRHDDATVVVARVP